ncbi:MAG: hypothetical protein IJ862_01985 [Selenomonadaceae bacterium]|nr:hypothetical protein [Selenomonadaceae bacterium]
MKKLTCLVALLIGIIITQIPFSNITFAKSKNTNKAKIAIVVVSPDATFKTKGYTNQARKDFAKDKSKNKFKFIPDSVRGRFERNKNDFELLAGSEIQNKYHKYWFDKGFLQEGLPSKETLVEFVQYSGYDKVIFLLVNNPIVTQTGTVGTNIATPTPNGGSTGSVFYTNTYEAALTMDAFLVDKDKIITTANASEVKGDKWSAFKKCVRSICSEIYSLL